MKVKMPVIVKTIRFKLALWYFAFLLMLVLLLVIGINTTMLFSRPQISEMQPPFPGDSQSWRQVIQIERQGSIRDLRVFSLIGAGTVLVIGAFGGYLLSGKMLKPVESVTSLASRISHTNIKERINHRGPDDEIKCLADTLDSMLQRLDSAFESQKQFIQDASHELRTPIAIAQTNIEVLEMDRQATVKDYRHLMDVIKLSLERMNGVNDSLLLLSESAPAKAKWSKVDISSLMSEVQAEADMEAKVSSISLELKLAEESLAVKGDATHLKQAVINLVDNAIKYNHPNGSVKLSAQLDGDNVVIQVEDTGTGIAPQDLSHVFDRFYRVEKSRSRDKGGSGLGLSIAKKIVEDHGGTVSVESVLGSGSTFRILLPVYK